MKALSTSLGDVAAIRTDGESPLLVFLHCIQGTKELFAPVLQESFLKGRATLAVDLLGFGDSPRPADFDYSISSFGQFIEEIIPYDTELVIIGHSLGGMIATRLLDSKLKIKGLVSLEGNLKLADCGTTREVAALSEREFVSSYFPDFVARLAASSEPSAAFRVGALRKADPQAFYRTSCSIVSESASEELFELLSRSSLPSLLLVGAKSSFSTRSIPGGAEVFEVPNSGHFLLHDNYPAVVAAIKQFLAAL